MGSTMGNDAEFDAVAKEFSSGRLRPVIDSVYDLEKGRDAFVRLAAVGRSCPRRNMRASSLACSPHGHIADWPLEPNASLPFSRS